MEQLVAKKNSGNVRMSPRIFHRAITTNITLSLTKRALSLPIVLFPCDRPLECYINLKLAAHFNPNNVGWHNIVGSSWWSVGQGRAFGSEN